MKFTIAWAYDHQEPPLPGAVQEGSPVHWVIELRDLEHLQELCQERTIMFTRSKNSRPGSSSGLWSAPNIWVDAKGKRFSQR